ncbi:MAG: tetratricopeptide repeat protein [Patescibacteria group bacterium]
MHGRYFLFLIFLSALALSFLLYGNGINGSFVYDDHFFTDRQELNSPGYLSKIWLEPYLPQHVASGLYRPLAIFSFALNFIVFGQSAVSFHLINVLLNGTVIFLVFLLVSRIFKDKTMAILSALFFAFLPIHTEAVSFIKSRDEIMSALFGILSWLAFISATAGDQVNSKKIWLSAFLFLLAVMSKELIIILPALFFGVYMIRQKPNWSAIFKTGFVFLVVAVFYMFLRFKALGNYAFGTDDTFFVINPISFVDFWTRFWTAFKIAFVYIGKAFVPINLSATYHYNQLTLVDNLLGSWQAISGMAILGGLIFLAISKKFRNTPLSVGALAFLIPYAVISKFIFKSGDLLAERWLYFPSLGLSIIGAYVFSLILARKKMMGILAFGAVLAIYAFVIIPRNKVWSSEENLFKSMVKTAPKSVQGYTNLANFYMKNDRLDEAREAAEKGFNIYKDYSPLLNVIGAIAFKDGNYDLARTAFLKAVELSPKIPLAYSNLGRLYYSSEEYDKAAEALEKAIGLYSIRPKPTDIFLYALSLIKARRYDDSIKTVNRYFSNDMDNSQVRFILAINYFKMGNLAEARKYFDWNPGKTDAEKIKILRSF